MIKLAALFVWLREGKWVIPCGLHGNFIVVLTLELFVYLYAKNTINNDIIPTHMYVCK